MDCPELIQKPCAHGDPVSTFAPKYKLGRELVLGYPHGARILAWVLEKRVCSHECPASSVLGHRARTPSVNVASEVKVPIVADLRFSSQKTYFCMQLSDFLKFIFLFYFSIRETTTTCKFKGN